MGIPASGTNPRSTIYVRSDGYSTVKESTTPSVPLADLYQTMDAAAVDNPRAESVLRACRKQIDVPLESTSCFLSIQSTLRGFSGYDRTYTCETAEQNRTPLFILNRMTPSGQLLATWIKNHSDLPQFNLAPEYQIDPEIRDLLKKQIHSKNDGTDCIISFKDSINHGEMQAAMRSGNCAFTWRKDEDAPTIKKLGETCPWDSPGSKDGDFLKIEDESQPLIETAPTSLGKEETFFTDSDELEEEEVSCTEKWCGCPTLPDAAPDFSRIYVAVLGAGTAYLGYRTYQAAKDLLYPVKKDDGQVDETGQRLEVLSGGQRENCKNDLSLWLRPVGFGLGSALCLAFALKV